jgi:prepilin signal peptidase PulO-like enzyme (type II secretory pathway)
LALPVACALLSALLWLRFGPTWNQLPASLGILLLFLIAAIDIDRRLVLNEVLIVAAALALLNAGLGGWDRLLASVAGGVMGTGIFLALILVLRPFFRGSTGAPMGAGDVKLVGLLGLMFGYPVFLRALLIGVLTGGLVSGLLLLARRVERKATLPYAPFLAAGGVVMLFIG